MGLILALGLLTVADGGGAWVNARIDAARLRAAEISQLRTAVTQYNAIVARHNAAVAREQQAARQVEHETDVLSNAHQTFLTALYSPSADSSNCSTVNCFNVTSLPDMNAFAAFGRTLRATPVPPGPAAIAKRLMADTAGSEQDYKEITEATSFDSIVNIATAAE